jgi:hypothetical protein
LKEAIITIARSPSSVTKLLNIIRPGLGWVFVVVTPLILFAIFLLIVGANPIELYKTMIHSVFGDFYGFGELLIKATPFILTALATALPAKAGLIKVGGGMKDLLTRLEQLLGNPIVLLDSSNRLTVSEDTAHLLERHLLVESWQELRNLPEIGNGYLKLDERQIRIYMSDVPGQRRLHSMLILMEWSQKLYPWIA